MDKIKSLTILKKLLTSSFKDIIEFIYNYLKFCACDNNLDKIEKLIEDSNFLKIKSVCEETTESILAEIRLLKTILLSLHSEDEVQKLSENFEITNDSHKKQLINVLKDVFNELKKKNGINSLQHFDWQISSIEREKKSSNMGNKYENVEMNFKFKISEVDGNNTEKFINMNYFEFKEVFECMKKMDNQLKMFKN